VEAEDDGMLAAVDETDVDPAPEELTSQQKQERRGVLAHLHHHEGSMPFPDDEFGEGGSGDSEEMDMKKEIIKSAPSTKQKGSGDSIYSLRRDPSMISGPGLQMRK
jgi:hypothetical protein